MPIFLWRNIDPVRGSSTLSSIFFRRPFVTWFSCVASLFLKVFISRAEIKWWSDYADNPPSSVRYWVAVFFFSLLCLAFISSSFAIALVIRYRSAVEKNNDVCLVGAFPLFPFLTIQMQKLLLQSFVSEWQEIFIYIFIELYSYLQ